jgi:hypothetical protein
MNPARTALLFSSPGWDGWWKQDCKDVSTTLLHTQRFFFEHVAVLVDAVFDFVPIAILLRMQFSTCSFAFRSSASDSGSISSCLYAPSFE